MPLSNRLFSFRRLIGSDTFDDKQFRLEILAIISFCI